MHGYAWGFYREGASSTISANGLRTYVKRGTFIPGTCRRGLLATLVLVAFITTRVTRIETPSPLLHLVLHDTPERIVSRI